MDTTLGDFEITFWFIYYICCHYILFNMYVLVCVRKTARNFNQPMCKAAKTTIVEVCNCNITVTCFLKHVQTSSSNISTSGLDVSGIYT